MLLKNVLKEISSEIPEKCWANETWHPHELGTRVSVIGVGKSTAHHFLATNLAIANASVCSPGHYDFNRYALLPYHPR